MKNISNMEDLNLHILMFSVLLACAQSFKHMTTPVEEEIVCEDARSEQLNKIEWTKFEKHEALPDIGENIAPKFHLYKRGDQLDHLAVLIHGFGSYKAAWAASMTEKIFEKDTRKNLGVLTVDWKEGAKADIWDMTSAYSRAAANTRYVALATHKVLQCLAREDQLQVHCVGHSLGAHTCGFLANRQEEQNGHKMWRVTGLDPAGPLFTTELVADTLAVYRPMEPVPKEQRLDAGDAELVDVVHTDGEQWGTMQPLGDIDFYVGKSMATLGRDQAGCRTGDMCDHSKAIQLFRESLDSDQQFEGKMQCEVTHEQTLATCQEVSAKLKFGYYYSKSPVSGVIGILQKDHVEEMKRDWSDAWEDWEDEWEVDEPVIEEEHPAITEPSQNEPKTKEDDPHAETEAQYTTETKVPHEFTSEGMKPNDEAPKRKITIQIDVVTLSAVVAILCFVVFGLLIKYFISHRQTKSTSVPDVSREVLLPV